jgi:protein-tyrosine phosphatase
MTDAMIIESSPSLAHRVLGDLWIGNAPPIVSMHEDGSMVRPLMADFDTVVLCASEYQPDSGLFTVEEVVHAPMDDSFTPVSKQCAMTALRAARHVVKRLVEDKRVLVTCLAGRNRSGLVCALALCFGPPGLSPVVAVRLVREARGPNALANPFFVRFLEQLDGVR